MNKPTTLFAAAVVTLALAACGGGGGSTGSDNQAPDDSAPPTTLPQDLPPQTTVPAPTYGATDAKLAAFDRINDIRKAAGLGLLAQNANLDQAAQAHAGYLVANSTTGHDEVPGATGFTGETHVERAAAAGYEGTTTEGVTAGFPVAAVDSLMNVPYHRVPLVSFRFAEVGLGMDTDIWDITYGFRDEAQQGAPDVDSVIWPVNGAVDVPPALYGEVPHPIPENNGAPFGYAVSLSVDEAKALTVNNFTLVGPAGAVDVKLLTAGTDTNLAGVQHYAAIIGRAPLQAATTYTASFTGAIDGVAHTKTWSFTTK